MSVTFLNLGILAHVDAGKTTLTERLLHTAGVIDTLGRVDDGTTQTDSLALERRRGITIRAAVVAFRIGDVTVNLIDTPGHPDFIAEVDRALGVLDGVVLVVSAVEGVQPQTLVLWRALRRLGVPTLIFVNKIDRRGADPQRVLAVIGQRLTDRAVPMAEVEAAGTSAARVAMETFAHPSRRGTALAALAEGDDRWLPAFADDSTDASSDGDTDDSTAGPAPAAVLDGLAEQTARGRLFPVYFGSAATGAGVADLMAALVRFLPTTDLRTDEPFAGLVFSVTTGPADHDAHVRIGAGTVAVRDRITVTPAAGRSSLGNDTRSTAGTATVTGLKVYRSGGAVAAERAVAGEIAVLSGLADIRVGDGLGSAVPIRPAVLFAPPTLETGITARDPARATELHGALRELARQDPLIDLRQDDRRHQLFVSLFGEVQKEVIAQTLALDYDLEVDFEETTTICVERVAGIGEAVERLGAPDNPFVAGLGLRIEPGPAGSGCQVRLDVDPRSLPLYVYSTTDAMRSALTAQLGETLRQGLSGWQVLDPLITVIFSDYAPPATTAGDVRKLAPLVVMAALRAAGTVVCEPIHRFRVDTPSEAVSAVLRLIGQHRGIPEAPSNSDRTGHWSVLEGIVPGSAVHRLQQLLPGISRGEGALETQFDHWAPLPGPAPTRPRIDDNPLDRQEFLRHVLHRR